MFTISKELNTRDLNRPQPLLRILHAMKALQCGQVLQLTTRGDGATAHIENLCRQTGLILMQYMDWDGEFTFFIRKSSRQSIA